MYWERLTTRRFGELVGKVTTALLPTGTVEAHGLHCPLGADNLAPAELCRRLEARYPDRLLVAPPVPYGHSWELEEWPGTLSIPAGVFARYVAEVGKGMVRWGIRDIVVINGHGGNSGALTEAAEEIADLGGRVTLSNWWIDYSREIRTVTDTQGHAGEDETSVMLAVAEEWVDMEHAVFNPYTPRFRFKDQGARKTTLRHAVTGDGRRGTKDKGERILELVTEQLDRLLQDLWADRLFDGQERG
jgi:creatinine amidohydrolase